MKIAKKQLQNSIDGLKAFESHSGIRINLSIKVKIN
jgi:hypothetical protein